MPYTANIHLNPLLRALVRVLLCYGALEIVSVIIIIIKFFNNDKRLTTLYLHTLWYYNKPEHSQNSDFSQSKLSYPGPDPQSRSESVWHTDAFLSLVRWYIFD